MATTSNLKVGQKVKFRPTHNKALELSGTIAAVSKDSDMVTVKAEKSKAVEVERSFEAHSSDVTVMSDAAEESNGKEEKTKPAATSEKK